MAMTGERQSTLNISRALEQQSVLCGEADTIQRTKDATGQVTSMVLVSSVLALI